MKNFSIKTTRNNRKTFTMFMKLFGYNFESKLFNFAGEFTQYSESPYNGGHWSVGYFGDNESFDTAFPIVPNDSGETFEVCNPENYFEGTMTNRAYGIAIYLRALSATSFQSGMQGHNASQIYHQIRANVLNSIESTDANSLTQEEGKMIFKFLD
jgi:hypothetical protein